MAETEPEHTLTRQNADEHNNTGLPEGPDMTDNAHTIVCKQIMAEMKIEHDKYEEIVKKIRSSIHQLFLVKCKVDEKEYHFLAEYKNDGFFDYFGKHASAFSDIQLCMQKKVKINRPDEVKRLNKMYGDGPSLGFKFLHNKKDVTIKIGPPNNRTISYEDFKNTFIPLNEAFMYKNMPETIDVANIVGLKPPTLPGALPMDEMIEEEVTHEVISDSEGESDDEFKDVEEDDGKVVDPRNVGDMKVEDIEEKVGGRKKRRKKRSRSKKKRRKRKNRTKKN